MNTIGELYCFGCNSISKQSIKLFFYKIEILINCIIRIEMNPIEQLFQRHDIKRNVKKDNKIIARVFFKDGVNKKDPDTNCFYCLGKTVNYCKEHQVLIYNEELKELKNMNYPDGYILYPYYSY
jgi:Pyruvate/2-oxoacid:ferredoxin oxidoreductase delta subunit